MKKIASRVLALVVALTMMLTATAFAAERNAATLSVGNFEITIGEQTLSLPVTLQLGGGVDLVGERGYITAGVATETASAISALAALENGEVKAYLNGMDYGVAIPMEQIVALIEEQLGMSLEEAMSQAMTSLNPQIQSALNGMTGSAAALKNIDIAPEAVLSALGLTLTEVGPATVTLFDVETSATEMTLSMKEQTCKEMFDALAALDPALKDYIDQYYATMNAELAAVGEDMTIEEALTMVSVGADGAVYAADNGVLAEVTMSVSAEGQTIAVPLSIISLTDETGTYTELFLNADVDGETAYFDIYVDNYAEEGVDYANFLISLAVGDTDAEANDVEFTLSVNTSAATESSALGIDVYVSNYGETTAAGVGYVGYPVVSTEASDSYDGVLFVYADTAEVSFEVYADTNLTLTNVPEGELLTFTQSINPLEADEETLNQFVTDAQNALIQGAGVLMQDPAIASMLGGLMG